MTAPLVVTNHACRHSAVPVIQLIRHGIAALAEKQTGKRIFKCVIFVDTHIFPFLFHGSMVEPFINDWFVKPVNQ